MKKHVISMAAIALGAAAKLTSRKDHDLMEMVRDYDLYIKLTRSILGMPEPYANVSNMKIQFWNPLSPDDPRILPGINVDWCYEVDICAGGEQTVYVHSYHECGSEDYGKIELVDWADWRNKDFGSLYVPYERVQMNPDKCVKQGEMRLTPILELMKQIATDLERDET